MKTWLRQNRGFLLFVVGFAFFRSAMADWNTIPSGSMRPTLLEGDVVLVDRLAYDLKVPLTDIVLIPLGEPRRGDVVTFTSRATTCGLSSGWSAFRATSSSCMTSA